MTASLVIIKTGGEQGATGATGATGADGADGASGYPLPIDTTQAALLAIGNAINTTDKTKHKLVSDENDRVYRALGSAAASVWRPLDDQSGASDIPPA